MSIFDGDPAQQFLGVKLTTLLAGLFGGLVRSLVMGNRLTTGQAIASTIVGAFTAAYLTPVALHMAIRWGFLDSDPMPGSEAAAGYLIGLTGMILVEGVIRLARKWRDDPQMPPAA